MNWIEWVGLLGAFLSSITFIPQVYKAWQTKSVGDLSLTMMLIVFTSTIVWLIYGVQLNLLPVIICNAIICALSLALIYFKFTFKRKAG
jgi:MtN3 and saliva related transmembrane protein